MLLNMYSCNLFLDRQLDLPCKKYVHERRFKNKWLEEEDCGTTSAETTYSIL